MKFSLAIVAMALLAATVTCHQDADAVVPEAEIHDAAVVAPKAKTAQVHSLKKVKTTARTEKEDAVDAFKHHMAKRIKALNQRKRVAVRQTKAAMAKQRKAQWATARIQATNKALVTDMNDDFPVLVKSAGKEETKYQDMGYGKCVTPPELPSVEHATEAFNAKVKDKFTAYENKKVVDSVGAIRTMCASEIKSKGSTREKNEKILVKTQKTEAAAKEASTKAENQGAELKYKAESQEHDRKASAEQLHEAAKESANKAKMNKESSMKGNKEATVKSEATHKVASQEAAAKESKSKAGEKKEKIIDMTEAHVKAKKQCEHAEEKKTVVVKSTDTTIEVKGKHEWQHQELTDKAGVEHSHKEMQYKMNEIIKNAAPQSPTITVRPGLEKSMKAQRHTMEASQKQQETSMKEYMHKEGTQKASETKSKVKANELVLKSNENSMKKASHDTKPVTNVVVYSNKTEHPTKEVAAKLIHENHELWHSLEKAQKKQTEYAERAAAAGGFSSKAKAGKGGADGVHGEVVALKEEVHELEHKLSITAPPTAPPTPAPTVICHKENHSKHPFHDLEKNVKAIISLKEGVTKSKKKCAEKEKYAEKAAKEGVADKLHKMHKETEAKKFESYAQLERMQKVLVAAKMTAKEKDHEICDKSRVSSEMSNKHQTSFWLGLVKELKVKSNKNPEHESAEAWKNKLCAAVHEDIGMVSGIDRAAMIE